MKKSVLFRGACVALALLIILPIGGCKRKNNARSSGLVAELSDSANAKEAVYKETSVFEVEFNPNLIDVVGDQVVYFTSAYSNGGEGGILGEEDIEVIPLSDGNFLVGVEEDVDGNADQAGEGVTEVTVNAVGAPTPEEGGDAEDSGEDSAEGEDDSEGDTGEGYLDDGYSEGDGEDYIEPNYTCAWILGDKEGNLGEVITYTPTGVVSAGIMGNPKINSKGEIYFLESSRDPESEENTKKTVVILGLDGKVKKRTELSFGENFYAEDMCIAPDGRILILKDGAIVILDKDGRQDGEIVGAMNDYVSAFYVMKDDNPLVMVYTNSGCEIRSLDLEAKQFKEVLFTGYEYSQLVPCTAYDFCTKTSDRINGYMLDGTTKTIMNFPDSNVVGNEVSSYLILDEETVLLHVNEGGDYGFYGFGPVQLSIYKKVPPEEIKDKTIITIGGIYMDRMMSQVVKFNKASDEYQLRVVSYEQFNTESDYEGGEKQLRNDMLTKTGPDIIVTSSLSDPTVYMRKGLFADMYPLMDKAGLKKEEFMTGVLKAGSRNDKLYIMIPQYTVTCCKIMSGHLNGKEGLTIAEMMEIEKKYGLEGKSMMYVTRDDIVVNALTYNPNDYYDLETGKCKFDSQGFKDLLIWANKYPAELNDDVYDEFSRVDENTAYKSNQLILRNFNLSNIRSFNRDDFAAYDRNCALIGFPSSDGKSTGVIIPDYSIAISSKCKHKDEAFEFVKLLISEELQDPSEDTMYSWEFPIRRSSLQKYAEIAMQKPYWIDYETGEKVYEDETYFNEQEGRSIPIECITQDRVDYVLSFIDKADHCTSFQKGIINLVSEDSAAYFSGQKTVDEVCDIIQNRVKIYVGENQ